MKLMPIFTLFCSAALLTGCGGSSSDESATYPTAYVQLYNASANSASTSLSMGLSSATSLDNDIGSAGYTDTSPLASIDAGEYKLELSYLNTAGSEVTVLSDKTTLEKGKKTLLLLNGDYASPNLMNLTFQRDDTLDSQFKLIWLNLINDGKSYDLYLGDAEKTFADATLVGTTSYKAVLEAKTYALDSYVLYLTSAGSKNIVFQSSSNTFAYETEHVLVSRPAIGPAKNKLAIDIIGNTTSVVTLEDVNANAQFRVYNSIDNVNPANIHLGNVSDKPRFSNLAADTISPYLETVPGDYRVSLTDGNNNLIMRNGLVTLEQGSVKSIVFYKDANDAAAAITLTDSKLPQVFDFNFNVVNLIPNFDQISVYFVKPGQTMDSSALYINTLNYASQSPISLPAGEYTMFIVHKDKNNNKILLAQTEQLTLQSGAHYLLVAEPDYYADSGYKLNLVK